MKLQQISRILLITLAIIAVLSIIPYSSMRMYTPFVYMLLHWIALSLSLNLMVGFTGYLCFGQVFFYGMGTTIVALLISKLSIHPILGIIIGSGVAVALIGMAIGWLTLRLRGPYFAIVTVAINAAALTLFSYLFPYGITLSPHLYDPLASYYSMIIIIIFVAFITHFIQISKLGLALKAINDDEDVALTFGVNISRYKILTFIFSATFTGLVGGTDIWRSTYTIATTAFAMNKSISMISMTMFGGAGTLTGPILGACILYIIEYYLWASLPLVHLMIYGLLIIFITLFMPQGLVGLLREKIPKLRKILI
jgi:branched-chain amino acid transport system permease protein